MRLALAMLVLIVGSAAAETSMKGWEIYSWPDKACAADSKHPGPDAVCFALLPGTNRMKSAPEIKKAPLSLAELVKRLGTLTKGEELFWTVGDTPTSNQFDQPTTSPTDPRRKVVDTAAKLELKLSITPVPPNVGTITMAADGSIELHLRSLPPGPIAETVVRYKPGDAKYKDMIAHVGGLAVGDTKMLPPWPQ